MKTLIVMFLLFSFESNGQGTELHPNFKSIDDLHYKVWWTDYKGKKHSIKDSVVRSGNGKYLLKTGIQVGFNIGQSIYFPDRDVRADSAPGGVNVRKTDSAKGIIFFTPQQRTYAIVMPYVKDSSLVIETGEFKTVYINGKKIAVDILDEAIKFWNEHRGALNNGKWTILPYKNKP